MHAETIAMAKFVSVNTSYRAVSKLFPGPFARVNSPISKFE